MTPFDPEEDEPEGYTPSALVHQDDREVIAATRSGPHMATAKVELARRRRFENAWGGEWNAGPTTKPIPPPQKVNSWKKSKPSLWSQVVKQPRAKPLSAVEVLDGRLNRCQREYIPPQPKGTDGRQHCPFLEIIRSRTPHDRHAAHESRIKGGSACHGVAAIPEVAKPRATPESGPP